LKGAEGGGVFLAEEFEANAADIAMGVKEPDLL
jgi:hypothetical protein